MTNAKEVISEFKEKYKGWILQDDGENYRSFEIIHKDIIQTIIHLYEEELKEIGEDEAFQIQADGEYHFLENQKTIAINKFKDHLRQSIQSKIDEYKEFIKNY